MLRRSEGKRGLAGAAQQSGAPPHRSGCERPRWPAEQRLGGRGSLMADRVARLAACPAGAHVPAGPPVHRHRRRAAAAAAAAAQPSAGQAGWAAVRRCRPGRAGGCCTCGCAAARGIQRQQRPRGRHATRLRRHPAEVRQRQQQPASRGRRGGWGSGRHSARVGRPGAPAAAGQARGEAAAAHEHLGGGAQRLQQRAAVAGGAGSQRGGQPAAAAAAGGRQHAAQPTVRCAAPCAETAPCGRSQPCLHAAHVHRPSSCLRPNR